jgi:hypothetical protein
MFVENFDVPVAVVSLFVYFISQNNHQLNRTRFDFSQEWIQYGVISTTRFIESTNYLLCHHCIAYGINYPVNVLHAFNSVAIKALQDRIESVLDLFLAKDYGKVTLLVCDSTCYVSNAALFHIFSQMKLLKNLFQMRNVQANDHLNLLSRFILTRDDLFKIPTTHVSRVKQCVNFVTFHISFYLIRCWAG